MKYKFKRKPREKQAEALKRSEGKKVFAFRMAQRTGKSKVIIDKWAQTVQAGKSLDLFVVAPGGCYRTWLTAIADDLPDVIAEKTTIHVWTSGTYNSKVGKERLNAFLHHKGVRIFLMNVEALSSVDAARLAARQFLERGGATFTIDESTCVKNYAAECTKFINTQLSHLAEYRFILSGLITPKSPLDLYSQFEFLDKRILGYDNFFAFRARYAVMQTMDFGGRKTQVVVGHRDVPQLYKKIDPWSFRVRLEDCYDLPPSTYSVRDVALTEQQERMYEELKKYATAEIIKDKHVTATVVITQILRLHQLLCGHTRDEEGGWHAVPEKRTASLIELLEDYEGKAIIWCSYDADVRKVSEALEKKFGDKRIQFHEGQVPQGVVSRFWGGNRKTREQEEFRFKTKPECLFMVATPDAGGMGRTWDVADLVVYHSSRNNLQHRMQSEERPKGVGKTTPIAYIDLQAVRKDGSKTVEHKIVEALRGKIDMAAVINGDSWRQWLI